jgi:hypothetical protein
MFYFILSFHLSDKQQYLFADTGTFLLDAGSHVTFGLATILVYRYVPIGCSLPRDLPISNFCCYQKVFYWTLLATIVTVYKL